MNAALTLPDGPFVLTDAVLPAALCGAGILPEDARGLTRADLVIVGGRIAPPWQGAGLRRVDMAGRMVLPPYIDAHVHLDKAFTIQRTGPANGTLPGAIGALAADAPNQTPADLAARMAQGAARALAHGTGALRTHLDTMALPDDTASWDVFADLQARFAGKLALQAVALGAIERALEPQFDTRCAQLARRGGVLGAFIAPGPVPHDAIRALLAGADRYGLDVDFHVDEHLRPGATALGAIANCMIDTRHQGRVVAGHCCALSLLEGDALMRVLDKVAQAGIHVIALPLTNLFLQDRRAEASPRRRGIAPLRELLAAGVPVCAASDNVQDAFHPFGDFDMREVLRAAILGGHLEQDMAAAADLVLGGAAGAMGIDAGRIRIGGPADLTLTQARDWFGLLSGAPGGTVLRAGRDIDAEPLRVAGGLA